MNTLADGLAGYTRQRAEGISEADAHRAVAAALEQLRKPSAAGRHWRNLASAAALALVVSGALVFLQLRQTSRAPITPPTVAIPDDVVTLWSYHGYQTFRLRDHKLSVPRSVWLVADHSQLEVTTTTGCTTSVFRLIDPRTKAEMRSPVTLAGCFESIGREPLILPDATVLLYHYRVLPSPTPRPGQDAGPPTYVDPLGVVRYDWRAGRVMQTYPGVSAGNDILLAPDGRQLYVVQTHGIGYFDCMPPCGAPAQDVVSVLDLKTGESHRLFSTAERVTFGDDTAGRLVTSPDGRRLYLDEPFKLYIYDVQGGGMPQVVLLSGGVPIATHLPSGIVPLPLVSVAAKNLGGPFIAADPRGKWVAALVLTDRGRPLAYPTGLWLVRTDSTPQLIGRFHAHDPFRGVAASSDGRVLYLLEEGGQGRYLLMVDPASGKDLGEILLCTSTGCDGFDAIAAVTPAG